MAQQIVAQVFGFRDAKGYKGLLRTHISYSDTSAASVQAGWTVGATIDAALIGAGPNTLPLTNAAREGASGIYGITNALGYGAAAQYLNIEDKLVVALFDSGGSMHRFGIPAPVIAAFLADQETGKGSQLVDFVAAMTTAAGGAFACTANGLPFVTAVGSVLVRRTQRRKVTLVSKSSNLDEPGE